MSADHKIITLDSHESEMIVLGCMLTSCHSLKVASDSLTDSDLHQEKHKVIFQVLKSAYIANKPTDAHLVCEELKKLEKLKEVGDVGYILDLAQYAGTSSHIEAYCDELRELGQKRQLTSLLNSLSTDIQQGADSSKIIDKIKGKIGNLEKHQTHSESTFRYLLENNSEKQLIDDLKKISPGVSTGFSIGEESIKIPGGAVSVIAMPTSHGKTATLINFSLGVLNHHHDKSVYFFTYEESGASIQTLFINTYIDKVLSNNNRESIKSFFGSGSNEYFKEGMRDEFSRDKKAFFTHLIDSGRLKVFYSEMYIEELIAAIRYIKKNTSVGLICIDYMQLLKSMRWNQGTRQEELKQICLSLKDCSIETGLPILLGAQFSRQVTMEADLSPIYIREAADIEHIASLIIGGWNRNFEGFSKEGNKGKDGKSIPKESSIYFEILKGRGIGNGHNSVMDFNGNCGKITNRVAIKRIPIGNKK